MNVTFTGIKNIATTDFENDGLNQDSKHIVLQLDNEGCPDLQNYHDVFNKYPNRHEKAGILEIDVYEKYEDIDDTEDGDSFDDSFQNYADSDTEEKKEIDGSAGIKERNIYINKSEVKIDDAQIPILLKVAKLLENISMWNSRSFIGPENDTMKNYMSKILINKTPEKDEFVFSDRLAGLYEPGVIKENAREAHQEIIEEIIIHLEKKIKGPDD